MIISSLAPEKALKFKGRGDMTKDSVGGWGKAFKNVFKCVLPLWLRVNIAVKSLFRSYLIEIGAGGIATHESTL